MTAAPTIDKARDVYRDFLKHVVRDGVFSTGERDRGGARPLGDERRKEIEGGVRVDSRPPHLATLSGKGGWLPDQRTFKQQREPFVNVSLIEHLSSVVRGALVFAEIDLKAARTPLPDLRRRLVVVAAVAFLHDADKMLEQDRREELDPGKVGELMRVYRIDQFLSVAGNKIDPERMASLIDQVELTRAGRVRPGGPLLTNREIGDCAYVTLADRLDGIYLDTRRGVDEVVNELQRFDNLRTDVLRGWRAAKITSPHTPFLLDELQSAFSCASVERYGHPPLIEVHHDGELLLVAPEEGFDEAYGAALDKLAGVFDLPLRVHISARGTSDIRDGGKDVHDLYHHLDRDPATARRSLQISVDCVASDDGMDERQRIDGLFAGYALPPRWPDFDKHTGRFVTPWPGSGGDEGDEEGTFVVRAATVAIALGCKAPHRALDASAPDVETREKELFHFLDQMGVHVPEWLIALDHDISRRNLLAALAAAATRGDCPLLEKGGVVDQWLRGTSERGGLLPEIDGSRERFATPVCDWFLAAARGSVVRADENAEGRCHFTNTPVPRSSRIELATGLYGLNVSAFSGREGRRESFSRTRAETLVSPLAQAEHQLRSRRARRSGRAEIPVFVSSPTTGGLFGSLVYQTDELPVEFALTEVLREKRKPDVPEFRAVDVIERRHLIGRYESLPSRMVSRGQNIGIVSFVKMVFEAARRMGRPLHVFRGLPRPNPAFVSFDFLPPPLVVALGGASFRLEELPSKIELLRLVEDVASARGLGLEIAARVADPQTRFGAACEAVVGIKRLVTGQGPPPPAYLEYSLLKLIEDTDMHTKTDDVIIRYAEAMSHVQRAPIFSDGDTISELGFRLALEAVESASQLGQTSPESLAAAVAGSLSKELERKDLFMRRKSASHTAVEEAARLFIDAVWPVAFRCRFPSTRQRRIALAIYRISFERAARAAQYKSDETNAP